MWIGINSHDEVILQAEIHWLQLSSVFSVFFELCLCMRESVSTTNSLYELQKHQKPKLK